MLPDNIYKKEEYIQWTDEQPFLLQHSIWIATDAPPEEGTEAPCGEVTDGGQRRGLTIVCTVVVVAVMDDNHKSVSHRRVNSKKPPHYSVKFEKPPFFSKLQKTTGIASIACNVH
jgi:hypothetical protein